MIIAVNCASSCKEPGVDRRAQHTSRTIPKVVPYANAQNVPCALRLVI